MSKKKTVSLPITTIKHLLNAKGINIWVYHIPFILRCAGIVFLIIALARPQKRYTEKYLEGEGIDIMLCIDVSGSMVDTTMVEPEFVPNRLIVSKELAKGFIRTRTGDRIGVVFFSNQGFTACPLTTDSNAVLTQIENIKPDFLTQEGTSIGNGIATSLNRLKDSKSKNKIILLLSDGDNSTGTISPDTAATLARAYNIKIYTIGIGSEKEVMGKIKTPYGEIEQRKKLEFNEVLLKDVAQNTGGKYFHASDKSSLKTAYESINSLEKSKIQKVIYTTYVDKYLPFLIAGFLFIFLELCLRYTVFKKFP